MNGMLKIGMLITLGAVMLTSCSKDDNGGDTPQKLFGGAGHILLETTVKNPDGISGQSYVQQIPKFEGSLDMSKTIQVGFASSISCVGNDVYIFPEFGNQGAQVIRKYKHTDKGLAEVGSLPIIPNSYPINLTQVNKNKAYVPMYNLGRVMIINPQTMTKLGEIDLSKYAHKDTSVDPSYGIIRDGYYYLPLDQIGPNWMPYDDYRQVDVAVIDTKMDKLVKVITEKSAGLCFPTRPFLDDMIFTTENKDIYMACTGYFGFNPSYVKNGFVCIPAGQQDFDVSKTWDISDTPIEGSPYKASAIYNCLYLGHGKVAAYVGVIQLLGKNPYTSRNAMAVVIDLPSKTIKKIEGIPYTDGHSVAIAYQKGQVYFSAYGVNASGVFAYQPETGQVKQVLDAKANITYMHIFE